MRSLESVGEETSSTESKLEAPSRSTSRSSTRSDGQDEYHPQSPSETIESGDFIQVPSDLSDGTDPDIWGRNEELLPLTSEQCMIADPWLIAFDLRTKRWGKNSTFDTLPE